MLATRLTRPVHIKNTTAASMASLESIIILPCLPINFDLVAIWANGLEIASSDSSSSSRSSSSSGVRRFLLIPLRATATKALATHFRTTPPIKPDHSERSGGPALGGTGRLGVAGGFGLASAVETLLPLPGGLPTGLLGFSGSFCGSFCGSFGGSGIFGGASVIT